jgi:hypothetical protein
MDTLLPTIPERGPFDKINPLPVGPEPDSLDFSLELLFSDAALLSKGEVPFFALVFPQAGFSFFSIQKLKPNNVFHNWNSIIISGLVWIPFNSRSNPGLQWVQMNIAYQFL